MQKNHFIYLIPGNWFSLQTFKIEKANPYDIEMFQKEILEQVENRSDKLSFIDITFASKYREKTIESIDFHLDKKKFAAMIKMMSDEKFHPIITFHGTTSMNAVESILAHGYVIPEKNIQKVTIKKAHGSAYGVGVYSSPFFEKSIYYTMPDNINMFMF